MRTSRLTAAAIAASLLLAAGLVLGGTGEEEPVKADTATRPIPPIDRSVPEKVETATFGLG